MLPQTFARQFANPVRNRDSHTSSNPRVSVTTNSHARVSSNAHTGVTTAFLSLLLQLLTLVLCWPLERRPTGSGEVDSTPPSIIIIISSSSLSPSPPPLLLLSLLLVVVALAAFALCLSSHTTDDCCCWWWCVVVVYFLRLFSSSRTQCRKYVEGCTARRRRSSRSRRRRSPRTRIPRPTFARPPVAPPSCTTITGRSGQPSSRPPSLPYRSATCRCTVGQDRRTQRSSGLAGGETAAS